MSALLGSSYHPEGCWLMLQLCHDGDRPRARHAGSAVDGSLVAPAAGSEVAALVLLALDRLEEGLEVALPEAERAMPLDELEEDGRAVAEGLREDLQEVAVLVAVDEDAATLQLLDRDPDLTDPSAEGRVLVVGVGSAEELDTVVPQCIHGLEDVVGRDGEVLRARALVELEVLVDLALALPDGRLVEWELHPVVPVGHDLGHEGGVVGGDVLADELGHVHEAHDPVVEAHPLVHLAELDVADDVVEGLEEPLGLALATRNRRRRRHETWLVGTGVTVASDDPLDEGVSRVAVGGDGSGADGPVLVGLVVRLLEHGRAGPPGLGDAPVHVRNLEGDVDDTVAVLAVVVRVQALGGDRAADEEPDRAGLEDVGLVVAMPGLRPPVGDQLHAPGGLVVVRGLCRVADDEDDGVPTGDREDVLGFVVGDQSDELLQLVDVEAGVAFLLGQIVSRVAIDPGHHRRRHARSIRRGASLVNRYPTGWSWCARCCQYAGQGWTLCPCPRRTWTSSTPASCASTPTSRTSVCSAPPAGWGWPGARSRLGSTGSPNAA